MGGLRSNRNRHHVDDAQLDRHQCSWLAQVETVDVAARRNFHNPGWRLAMTVSVSTPEGDSYASLLAELKVRIRAARLKAAVAVNWELILLYWNIGRDILARQTADGWGAHVIDRLAGDLRREFPDAKGLSPRNLKYMRAFAEAFPDEAIVQQAVAQLR
jgi:hypothetical protein